MQIRPHTECIGVKGHDDHFNADCAVELGLRRRDAHHSVSGLNRGSLMPKYPCPVCGDPSGFIFWVDPEPPSGCPHDMENWDSPKAIKNVAECKYQRGKAWQAAEFRKLVPDAFDASGKMLPGQLGRVLTEFGKYHPKAMLII